MNTTTDHGQRGAAQNELLLGLAESLEELLDPPPPAGTALTITLPLLRRPFTAPLVPHDGVYWHLGQSGFRLLTLGTAWSHTLSGEDRLQQAETAYYRFRRNWIESDPQQCNRPPRLLFHYAFAAEDPMAAEWSGFPNTELRLPLLQLGHHRGQQWLSCSAVWQGESTEQLLSCWAEAITELEQLLDTPATPFQAIKLEPVATTPAPLRAALAAVAAGQLEKIVVSQRQQLNGSASPQPRQLLQQLERDNPSGVQFLLSSAMAGEWFVAAPPERLLQVRDNHEIEVEAVAGTLPRGKDSESDFRLQQQLLQDPKLVHEHRLVVDYIQETLRPLTNRLTLPPSTRVHLLPRLQHLRTPVHGTLQQSVSLFQAVEQLHHHPALCGLPVSASHEWLRQQQNSDRGYYCGGAGWIDHQGQGEVYVLLRCTLLQASRVHPGERAGGDRAQAAGVDRSIQRPCHTPSPRHSPRGRGGVVGRAK